MGDEPGHRRHRGQREGAHAERAAGWPPTSPVARPPRGRAPAASDPRPAGPTRRNTARPSSSSFGMTDRVEPGAGRQGPEGSEGTQREARQGRVDDRPASSDVDEMGPREPPHLLQDPAREREVRPPQRLDHPLEPGGYLALDSDPPPPSRATSAIVATVADLDGEQRDQDLIADRRTNGIIRRAVERSDDRSRTTDRPSPRKSIRRLQRYS